MSNLFLNQVKMTIEKYKMLERNDTVIVGVSGGPDSVALLHVLNLLQEQYDLKIYVVHVNHMFRGEEAKREARFVAKLAADWDLDCEVFERDVPALIKAKGLSPQEAGHQVRKRIFEEVHEKIGATKLALGHHVDDRAETILLHLIQGTGLDGLASMPPRDDWLIRPLAQVSKEDIINYCKENNLLYCLDPSNKKAIYLRNKIRLNLIPYLEKEYNPQMVENLLKLGDIIIEENNFLEKHVENILDQVIEQSEKGKLTLDLIKFRTQHLAVQRRIIRNLYKILRSHMQNLSFTHVEQIIEIARNEKGAKELYLPNKILIKKSYSTLEFIDLKIHKIHDTKKLDFCYDWFVPGNLILPMQQIILNSYYTAIISETGGDYTKIVVDGSKIKSPLIVRNRRSGDRIQPLGMSGSKKLKKLFIDRKVDKDLRDTIPIVCSGSDIVWLPGLAMSEKFKVSQETKSYLVLEMEKDYKGRICLKK